MTDQFVRVVAGVVARGQTFLVCRRPHNKRYGRLWEFPGGKCFTGEALAGAISRELSEELGVKVIAVGAPEFIVRDHGSPHLLVFVPVSIDRDPTCHEHTEMKWVNLQELSEMPLAPCDRLYLDFMVRRKHGEVTD